MRQVSTDRLRRFLIWPAILCFSFSLQGCLLDYFFAPKIAASELPSDPAMEPLRSAYIAQCGRCHLLVAPVYFNRERPIDAFTDRYLAAKIINRQEADEVATYIRALSVMQPAVPSPRPTPLATPPMPTEEDSESEAEPESTPKPSSQAKPLENEIIPLPATEPDAGTDTPGKARPESKPGSKPSSKPGSNPGSKPRPKPSPKPSQTDNLQP